MPKTILVASNNPVKKKACQIGFKLMYPEIKFILESVSVASGVGEQPISDQETLAGAVNRSTNAKINHPEADYWVGIEGGIQTISNDLAAFAWVVIQTQEYSSKSRTGTFMLPEAVTRLIRDGKELGEADDIVFNRRNTKQENGAVGLLTNNIIDRCDLYAHAVVLALIPFKNPELYLGLNKNDEACK